MLRAVLILLLALVAYLAAWPTSVAPISWAPDRTRGDLPPNQRLAAVRTVTLQGPEGPEDIAIGPDGAIYAGMVDGEIVRVDAQTGAHEVVVNTGGRPLGLDWESRGRLIIADAVKGLLSLNVVTGNLEVLATEADGRPFLFTDDVDVGPDGLIYFSDASDRFGIHDYKLDLLESAGNGRLLRYDPANGEVETLVDALQFANGVAVAPDASFVLVVETGRYRVLKHWLDGPSQGATEVLIDRLPGFPDGVSANGRGTYWVAIPTPRNPLLDNLASMPRIRKVVARLPRAMHPQAVPYSMVLGVNEFGHVAHNLQQPDGRPLAMITSVEETAGKLYLGSLVGPAFGILPVPN